jgi:all-trans-retinol 13,14-reductase
MLVWRMHIGSKYTPDISQKNYDVIIIGSGISGLTLANLQAKQGRSVLVLEKHYTAGGFTHSYSRKGFEWDSGLHYVGEVHQADHPLRKMFDFLSDNNLKWSRLPDEYDRMIFPDETYSFMAGKENFKEEILKHFPKERNALEQYLKLISKMSEGIGRSSIANTMPPWLGSMVHLFDHAKYFKKTTYDVLKTITQDEKLISVLSSQCGDYGLPPKQSSFGVHGVIANHYMNGGSFPIGGSTALAKTIVKSIEDHGGKVVIAAGVEKVLVKKSAAYGVLLENGDTILGKKIVSSAGLLKSYQDFFKPEDLPTSVSTPLKQVKPSVSYMSLTLGINRNSSFLNHDGGNLWVYSGHDHDENYKKYLRDPKNEQLPMCYISFPSLKDPSWNQRMGEKTCIDMLGVASYDWFKAWDGTKTGRRGAGYEQLKEDLMRPYFKSLYKLFPQLENNIDHYEISTPLTVKNYSNYKFGEIYGREMSPERFAKNNFRPKTPIKNFFLTGQDTLLHGICGAMMSGVMTSISMNPVDTLSQMWPVGVLQPPN